MVIGQGLLVGSTPFLTRLYTPEDFGLFAVFGAFASILITIVTLRYETAIPLERDNRVAAALVAASGLVGLLFSLLICLLVLVWGESFARLLNLPALAPLLWLLPPCLLLWGLGTTLSLWSIRLGTFRLNGANRIIHHGMQAGGQLALGPTGIGGAGLIFGYVMGCGARFGHFFLALPKAEMRTFTQPSLAEIVTAMRCYWRHPVFSASSAVLQVASLMLPAVFITLLYGSAMAGWYALAQRVVALPLRLIGEGASEVFLGEIRAVDQKGLNRLFKRTIALFTVIGLIVLLPLSLVAPWLFSIIFGAAWVETGVICQLLVPLYLGQFVAHPVSPIWNFLRRQELYLLSSICNGFALLFSFSVGWHLGLDAHWTIGLFSVSSGMVFLLTVAAAWRALRRVDWDKLRAAS